VTAEGAPREFVSVAAAPHEPTSSADVATWLSTTLMHRVRLSCNSQCVLSQCCTLMCWRRRVLKMAMGATRSQCGSERGFRGGLEGGRKEIEVIVLELGLLAWRREHR